MITAIPMDEQSVAKHFSKALNLAFFNEEGQEIFRTANPALSDDCSTKAALIALLEEQKAERVLVQRIGEKMLGRLLARAFTIFQIENSVESVSELATLPSENFHPLLDASQGTPSMKHEKKVQDGTSCCGKGESCCSSKSSSFRPQVAHSARHHSRGGRGVSRCSH